MLTSNRLRSWTVLLFALAQFAASFYFFGPADFETLSADGPVAAVQDYATPAGYAFAIWFLIYSLSVVYGVYQALPSQQDNALLQKIGWPMASCFAACIAWIAFARLGPAWVTIPIIWIMFACICFAFVTAVHQGASSKMERWVVLPLTAIYTGWLTAASALNITNILPEYGISILGLNGAPLAVFTLTCAGMMVAAICLMSRAHLGYVLTVSWALVAIIVSVVTQDLPQSVAVAAGGLLVGLAILTILIRRKPRTQDARLMT
jgi:hypothetical protein